MGSKVYSFCVLHPPNRAQFWKTFRTPNGAQNTQKEEHIKKHISEETRRPIPMNTLLRFSLITLMLVGGYAGLAASATSSHVPGVPMPPALSSHVPGVPMPPAQVTSSHVPGVPMPPVQYASSHVPGVPMPPAQSTSSHVPGVPMPPAQYTSSHVPGVPMPPAM